MAATRAQLATPRARTWKRLPSEVGGGEKEARVLFQHYLWYLPVIMALMMVHKQGIDWAKWFGLKDEDSSQDS